MTRLISNRIHSASALFITLSIATATSFAQQPEAPPQPAPAPSPQQPAVERQQPRFPPEVAAANEAFDKQDWPKAVELCRAAMAAGYEYAFVQMRTGYALHVQGKYAEALPFHLKAANAQQKALRVDGLYNAACAYALINEKAKAFEFLLKAVDAGFLDKKQIEGDSDLNSLRDDALFKTIVASIGVGPTLYQWMDFFIGEWEQFDAESSDEVLDHLTMTRPLKGSTAIVSTSRNIGGGEWTGLAWPDSDERIWRWTTADGNGTTHEFTGRRIEGGGMIFTGMDFSPAGPNVNVRLTFTLGKDGRVLEKAEVSSDGGKNWRLHHEAWYTKKTAKAAGQ